ncbi:dephospho-CoA kinase [Hydrotalea sp.]|uniref:dephospho-CoA kinase n=1 Tax=Hydrotalea sp. TaxID=2881279 RepID=UPI002634DC54|nr:dephospho-CoA kinase [Hydrotalea sp.]
MLKIGLTGGIGSGKTTVAHIFKVLDIPVLDADTVAKELMERDEVLIAAIRSRFGNEVYNNGKLNRTYLAGIVFKDEDQLEALNALVHPATIAYARQWMQQQPSVYVVKEAALFFESGADKEMDYMIGVTAPFEWRINRVMKRDGISRTAVLERMAKQMDENEKIQRCQFVIKNDETQLLIPQVFQLHKQFLAMAKLTV